MKDFIRKYWPSLVHIAGVAVVFLNPSVQHYLEQHTQSAATLGVAWGVALHVLTSPRHG